MKNANPKTFRAWYDGNTVAEKQGGPASVYASDGRILVDTRFMMRAKSVEMMKVRKKGMALPPIDEHIIQVIDRHKLNAVPAFVDYHETREAPSFGSKVTVVRISSEPDDNGSVTALWMNETALKWALRNIKYDALWLSPKRSLNFTYNGHFAGLLMAVSVPANFGSVLAHV